MTVLREKIRDCFKQGFGRPTRANESDFQIFHKIDGVLLCRSASGAPSIAIEMPNAVGNSVKTKGFSAFVWRQAKFDDAAKQWKSDAILIESPSQVADELFLIFCCDLISCVKNNSSSETLGSAVWKKIDAWIKFFQTERKLSREEELGLWGELWLIDNSRSVDLAIESWSGPSGATFDFYYNQVAIEIKTSVNFGIHTFSFSQTNGDDRSEVYVVSICAKEDVAGNTVSELVEKILGKAKSPQDFLLKLGELMVVDIDPSERRYSLSTQPAWFKKSDIPCIRQMDSGIIAGKYQAKLDYSKVASVPDQSFF